MDKYKRRELILYSSLFVLFFVLFFLSFFIEKIKKDSFTIVMFVVCFVLLIGIKESFQYNKNIPYQKTKGKKNFIKRIFIGLLAGLHYSHMIFTYNHKKYNTQVFYPETIECYFGLSWAVFLCLYGLVAYLVSSNFEGYWYFLVLIFPVITNIIGFFIQKK